MEKKFQRNKENFVCEKCGMSVSGDGYTNHCPNCLWSKHVDKNPGDRLEICKGMMGPISVEKKGDEWILTQKCEKCGFKRKNKTSENDSMEKLIEVSKIRNYQPKAGPCPTAGGRLGRRNIIMGP